MCFFGDRDALSELDDLFWLIVSVVDQPLYLESMPDSLGGNIDLYPGIGM